jgi:hypothetical protein
MISRNEIKEIINILESNFFYQYLDTGGDEDFTLKAKEITAAYKQIVKDIRQLSYWKPIKK